MISVAEILLENELSDAAAAALSERAKAVAVGCGMSRDNQQLQEADWDMVDSIADDLWFSDAPVDVKIKVGFQLFDLFPSYFHMGVPYYRLIRDANLEEKQENAIWKRFMHYLSSEDHYADPIAYVIWVELFEEAPLVEKTWTGLCRYGLIPRNHKGMKRLLRASGPVPFALKDPVLEKLIGKADFHEAIAACLLFSFVDVYGQVDVERAKYFQRQLKLPKGHELAVELAKRIPHKPVDQRPKVWGEQDLRDMGEI